MSLNGWMDELQRMGRYSFTREEAMRELSLSNSALKKSLQRATSQGRVLALRRGFYVIVPLEYSSVGTVPTEWFVADLMRFLGKTYYVGCLSAAAWHGAAHQRPQEMQVVVPDQTRSIEMSAVRIRFLRYAGIGRVPTETRRTHTGDVRVSTPEWTAIDLIRFQKQYGSMDVVATVLTELAEALDPNRLVAAANLEPTNAYLQRLGWILDFLGQEKLRGSLHAHVVQRDPSYIRLNPSLKSRSGHRDSQWRIIVNEKPAVDI